MPEVIYASAALLVLVGLGLAWWVSQPDPVSAGDTTPPPVRWCRHSTELTEANAEPLSWDSQIDRSGMSLNEVGATWALEPPDGDDWQSMETAPRDGTVVEMRNSYGVA